MEKVLKCDLHISEKHMQVYAEVRDGMVVLTEILVLTFNNSREIRLDFRQNPRR